MQPLTPDDTALEPGTTLPGGVALTAVRGRVGEALVYGGVHPDGREVEVREFYPPHLLRRVDGARLEVVEASNKGAAEDARAAFVRLGEAMRDGGQLHGAPRVRAVIEHNGAAYWVTPPSGDTLADWMSRRERASPELVIAFARRLADALVALEAQGLRHLDISPDTVAIADGSVRLIHPSTDRRPLMKALNRQDGLVRAPFAPIELHDGAQRMSLAKASDVYSAAAVVWNLMIGKPPAPWWATKRTASQPALPPSSGYSPAFVAAIERALAVLAQDRFDSAAAWRDALSLPEARVDDPWFETSAARPASPPIDIPRQPPPETRPVIDIPPPQTEKAPEAPPFGQAPVDLPPPAPPSAGSTPPPVQPSPQVQASPQAQSPPPVPPSGPSRPVQPQSTPANPPRKPRWGVILVVALALGASTIYAWPVVVGEQYYAVRPVYFRNTPSPSGQQVAQGDRGDVVWGRPLDGRRWVKVGLGARRGEYVSLLSLSKTRPPKLKSTEIQGWTQVRQGGPAYRTPNASDPKFKGVKAGERVFRTGETGDGWIEILWREGGVAYLRAESFAEPAAPAAPAEVDGVSAQGIADAAAAAAAAQDAPTGRPTSIRDALQAQQAQPSRYIASPVWRYQPDAATRARFMPRRALSDRVSAKVTADCLVAGDGALTSCRITSDAPARYGFVEAARGLLPYYRMQPVDGDGQPTANRRCAISWSFKPD